MKKEEIYLGDWQRLLFGETPPEFLIEVLLRTLVVYLALLVIVRWLGKRMSGQLTLSEMAVMVTLGAIISPAMQLPDRGVLMGLLVLLCTIVFHRGLNLLAFKHRRIETLTQGEETLLVRDGVLQLQNMAATRLSKQQIYAQLRGSSVYQLGEVNRLYLEACGLFSVYKEKKPGPGLSILPPTDKAIHQMQPCADDTLACANCGTTVTQQSPTTPCPVCRKTEWTTAVLRPDKQA